MNAKQILAVGFSVALVIAAIELYRLSERAAGVAETVVKSPGNVADKVLSFLKTAFDDKVKVSIQNDVLSVKPIGELALAKIRVRAIEDYRNTYLASEKVIIAHEAYDLKIGWDLNSDITISINPGNTITITAAKPRILSCERADSAPTILYQSDGVLNKLTPEDMIAVQQHLDASAKNSEEARMGMETAVKGFRDYFSALFQNEGYKVIFDFNSKKGERLP